MPLVILGAAVAAVGWLFLLGGVGTDTPSGGAFGMPSSVVNLHKLSIASNVIYLGYFLTLLGTLNRLFSKTEHGANATTRGQADAPADEHAPVEPKYSREVRKRLQDEFKARYRKTVVVAGDGSVRVLGLMRDRHFPTIQDAQRYCEQS